MTHRRSCTFINNLFKGLITVGRELRQQHPSDLLSGAGTSRRRTTNHSGVVVVTPTRPWSIPIMTWLHNRIYDKIRSKSPPNRATSPSCLHCDVTHLSLTTGVEALHIPSWRVGVREERRQALKTVWPVHTRRVIYHHQSNLFGNINHQKHIWYSFLEV